MPGFNDEKQMWEFERKRLIGKRWQRYELIFPDGHPDVKGSYDDQIIYVENKVAEEPDRKLLTPAQREYIPWLIDCGEIVWFAWGDPKQKIIRFTWGLDFGKLLIPPFWSFTALRR
jgi:hypothetical protein